MKRSTKLLVSILFPLVLITPPASVLLPIEPVEIENRALQRPDITLRNLTNPSFIREVLSYARVANPMRTLLIRVGAGLDFWVFDDSPDPTRVLKGTDDWLYFRPTFEEPCTAPPVQVAANVAEFVRRLEQHVPTVVLTVAPSKFVIHPEHLTPEQLELAQCALIAGQEVRALLAASSINHYVDGWELFEQLKAEGTQPYFRTDTHFNFEGSIPWMRALVDEVGDIWEPEAVQDLGQTMWLGNLMTFIGLDQAEEVRHVVVERNVTGITTEIEDIPRASHSRHSSDSVELVSGKTLILGDSFMQLPRASLIQYFADATVVDWRAEEGVDYFIRHAGSAGVIIIEISELDIWDRFGNRDLLESYESVSDQRTTSRP